MEVDNKPAVEPVQVPAEVTMGNAATNNIENVSPAAALAAATSQTPPAAPASSSDSTNRPRNVQIFSAPTSSTPAAARGGFNENDYLPTIEHAKSHQAALQTKGRNTRLLSDKELAEQEEARQAKLTAAADKGGTLRIRMPDGTLIQMDLTKTDTADGLYDFVKSFLDKKTEPFKLNHTGPTGRLIHFPANNKRLIQDLQFFNNELITFQWAEDASPEARASRNTLAREWQDKAQTLKVEDPSSSPSQKEDTSQKGSAGGQTVAEGKRKAVMSSEEKESKLKSLLGKGLFKKR